MASQNPNPSNNNNVNGKMITLKMGKNLKAFEKSSSPVMNIGGCKWRLEMQKKPVEKHNNFPEQLFDATIFCDLDENNSSDPNRVEKLWMCRANVALNVDGWHFADNFSFFNGHTSQKWAQVLRVGERDFSVEMNVSVRGQYLQPSLPILETDLQLMFNGKEEYVTVNKHALASISTYFRNLFFGNWSERAGDVPNEKKNKFSIIEEEDFDLPAFKLMLYSAMAMGCQVADGNFLQYKSALAILKLSIKYDVPMLQDYCQKFLLDPITDCPKMELLGVAEQLGLQQLKDHCLATITANDVAENFVHNADICVRLGKRTRELLDKRLKETTPANKKMRLSPSALGTAARAGMSEQDLRTLYERELAMARNVERERGQFMREMARLRRNLEQERQQFERELAMARNQQQQQNNVHVVVDEEEPDEIEQIFE